MDPHPSNACHHAELPRPDRPHVPLDPHLERSWAERAELLACGICVPNSLHGRVPDHGQVRGPLWLAHRLCDSGNVVGGGVNAARVCAVGVPVKRVPGTAGLGRGRQFPIGDQGRGGVVPGQRPRVCHGDFQRGNEYGERDRSTVVRLRIGAVWLAGVLLHYVEPGHGLFGRLVVQLLHAENGRRGWRGSTQRTAHALDGSAAPQADLGLCAGEIFQRSGVVVLSVLVADLLL